MNFLHRTTRSNNIKINNKKVIELFSELKTQIDTLKLQNTSISTNLVETAQSELSSILISSETMEFYFNKVEELYTKLNQK